MSEEEKPDGWDIMCRVAVLLILTVAFANGCSYVNEKLGLDDDWIGEEILEQVIEQETGLDLDLSPDSPE
tara:strand:- start:450 stop:659 length:210 start_codon:yes stop_codon:yes gene_type:complete